MNPLERLLSDLVAIDSINPDLVPGAAGEAEIARYIASWLERAGLEVHLHEPASGRPNVVGIAHGSGGGQALMLNGHMDTVGVGGMQNPFSPEIRNGRLYGRGSYDMKGGLAACMLAAAQAAQMGLRGDVIVAAVMDEENAGMGTLDIARLYPAQAAIVAEPTELDLVVAHRGFMWLEIETHGVAAHGSRPHLGVDAIAKMGRVLTGLEELDQRLRAHPTDPLLGSGSLHASLIRGGHEVSTYPAECVLTVERRTIPGETPDMIQAELQAILDGAAAQDPAFRASLRRGMIRSPMETPAGAAILPVMERAVHMVLGAPPELRGVSYWTDAATLWDAGIPSVLFGPTGAGAHAAEEWVEIASVQACVEVFVEAAREFCA